MNAPVKQPAQGREAPADGRDPDAKVPRAVREAAARSAEIMRQVAEGNAPPADPNTPPAQPPAEPQPTITITDAPPVTPPAPPQPPAEPQPQLTGDAAKWKNDFDAMKGRFDKANQNNIRLSQEIQNLQNVIATLSAAPPPAATPPELQASSLITPQERAEYGDEFLELIGKRAKEIAEPQIADLKRQIEQLSKGVTAQATVTAKTAREQMFAYMDTNIPNWQDINRDENFLAWLRLPDPFSGAIRQELLNAAFEQNATLRVKAFFDGFLAEEAATVPASTPPLAVPGAPPKVPLENFAAPGRAKSAPATPPAEKPIITRAQVTQFYADVAAGKYRGRDEEKAKNEAMIFAATAEGRLR
jgi:hypothetical protein